MNFKSEDSFLDKVTMGAVGTKAVHSFLESNGHHLIELERLCTSNKIWTTKVKRLRVPDLLCVNCGQRFECRAKSKLGIIMSDNPNQEDRRWDYGLRDDDNVVFIHCRKLNERWLPASIINVFKVKALRDTLSKTILSARKSASEGSEQDRRWPSKVPNFSGLVLECEHMPSGEPRITFCKDDGRRYTMTLPKGLFLHVKPGDRVEAGSCIVASVVPSSGTSLCPGGSGFSFIYDLTRSTDNVTVYAAIKALGHIDSPESKVAVRKYVDEKLSDFDNQDLTNQLLVLEALGSLLRLGDQHAYHEIVTILSKTSYAELRMEAALILGEIAKDHNEYWPVIHNWAMDKNLPPEVRAAAAWYAGQIIPQNRFVDFAALLKDADVTVRLHALVAISLKNWLADLPQLVCYLDRKDPLAASIATLIIRNASETPSSLLELLGHGNFSLAQEEWFAYILAYLQDEAVASFPLPDRLLNILEFAKTTFTRNWIEETSIKRAYDLLLRQLGPEASIS